MMFSVMRSAAAHPPTFPVKQPIDLLAIRPAYTTCNTVCILARPKLTGQLPKQQAVISLMRAYKVTLFSVYAGDLQGYLIGYRPRRRPRYLICGNLVGDVKDYDEPTSDLRIDIGDLRIDLIGDPRRRC